MEPNLLVLFVVGALLVLNGVLGNARTPQADDQESATAAEDSAEGADDPSGDHGSDAPALKPV